MRKFIIIAAALALVACQSGAGGKTAPATASTGVGQYGSLSGVQSGSTQLSIGGDIIVNVSGMAGLSSEERATILAPIKAIAAGLDAATDTETKLKLLDKLSSYAEKISKTFGVTIGLDHASGGNAGPGDLVPVEPEPAKPGGADAVEVLKTVTGG